MFGAVGCKVGDPENRISLISNCRDWYFYKEEAGTVATEEKKYEGIGGWLILIGFGLTVALIKSAYFIFMTYPPVIANGLLQVLIAADTSAQNRALAIFVMTEFIVNFGLMLSFAYLVFLFMKRRTQFPVWFIRVMAVNLVVMILDPVIIKMIMPQHQPFDEEALMGIARSAMSCLIWIPYMRRSKRVKATFTL
jgi:hypothetical protein